MTEHVVSAAAPHPAAKAKAPFRRDIEGLRAFALILVVTYHAGVGLLPGSFIGVDIFFVISGFLITGLLMAEANKTGTVSLRTFYARRVRRLLPAASVVIVATFIASKVLLPPLLLTQVAKDGLASAFNVTNMWLAWIGTDYLSDTTPSVFQHYWSLAIEEQFYLVWPVIFLLSVKWARNRRRNVAIVLSLLVAVSFVLCVWLTGISRGWAFFALPTRAWELGVGGLLALAWPWVSRISTQSKIVVSWAGFALFIVGGLTMNNSMAFPGWLALVPVIATAAVIVGDGEARGAAFLLDRGPMRWLGRISYSTYLWHWPLMIIPAIVWDRPLTLPEGLTLGVLSVLLGWLGYTLVEEPMRALPILVKRKSLNAVLALALVVVTVVAGLGVSRVPQLYGGGDAAVPTAADVASGTLFPSSVPRNVTPTLEESLDDIPAVYDDGCEAAYLDVTSKGCVYGNVDSDSVLVMFGDSRASQWFPALEAYAVERDMRLVAMTKSGCTPADVPIDAYQLNRPFPECDQFRRNALAEIDNLNPAMVVVSGYAAGYRDLYAGSGEFEADYVAGFGRVVSALAGTTKVVTIGDTPTWTRAPAVCLSAHLDDTASCTLDRRDAVDPELDSAMESVSTASGSTFIDAADLLCSVDTCFPLAGNELLYRDDRHISETAAVTLAPAVSAALDDVRP
ncbi:acyltransferase family protein [Rhodococcus sp. IEGM 1401]|uniref:acyltransferase family protein n=1 Tax=unclassified Rhodococcus (in: high G+C Gram-positive bacteria) TaxID=192944 RepID=UPI0022B2C66B|nr:MULTISPECIES: acyltransferase family protein [unclassified Rhodococcus (in: high G+C Gram-positive bacteria)]MCZ4560892.1 acyltransferase family protein [Rhodococcus sp. IEGM 1401]MDI9921033.1 acyltransferase family protein [Rhodococcus sp. IEGM 1372]MDV8033367.1 acyltransferase family protein [Rhodococcus sp. IEGM 1414]